jgi:predicted  nucleic acid-binding Zn-ribbon protein
MFEKILEYQKLDSKIMHLKREAEKDPAKQRMDEALSLIRDSQNQLLSLDQSARESLVDYEKCKNEFEKSFAELEKLSKEDLTPLSTEQLNVKLDSLNNLSTQLASLERALSTQAERVNAVNRNFDRLKKNIFVNKQIYTDSKEKCQEVCKKFQPQIDELKKQMLEMEKDIDPKIMSKYKHLRQDHIFPVFVPLNGTSCGGCSMEIPSALMNKLKENGFLECEVCRRYIYTE